jgi:DNA polymerase kappa
MSMISTANYEARKYGVRSAMPGFIARKLCPQLIFVPHSTGKYKQAAEQTRVIFADYDPNFTAGSLDEAYLDITKCVASVLSQTKNAPSAGSISCALPSAADSTSNCDAGSIRPAAILALSTPDQIADAAAKVTNELRGRVYALTGLTCSAGVASTRMLAKVGSDINKPNGQHVLKPDFHEIISFSRALRTRQVPGVGKVTEHILAEGLGVTTVGELWAVRHKLPLLMSAKQTHFLLSACVAATDNNRENAENSPATPYSFGHAEDAGGSSSGRKSISQVSECVSVWMDSLSEA